MVDFNDTIQKAIGGDALAFEEIVTTYEKKIYSLVYRDLGNEQDALDVTQDVFLRVFRFLPGFKAESSFSTWIYRIAVNATRDFIRKSKQHNDISLYTQDADQEDYEISLPDNRFNPEEVYGKKETAELLKKGIDSLSETHRDILLLREVSGMSYGEIADILSLDIGTVKSRIARARERLREYLLKNGTF